MVNRGSPIATLDITTLELVWKIREGEIKLYVYDEASGQWVRKPLISRPPKPPSSIFSDRLTLPNAPTPLGSGEVISVMIKAESTNSGRIYVGSSEVSETNGYPLEPGEVIIVNIDNLNKIWLNASVSGDSIRFVYSI
ncbi:MAG: hypothetical protein QW540_08030 [Archaeoglobaceae archaeon]